MRDLNDVLAFTHVADLGSFTAAAARLGWPKSSVSERVARLEAQLGARLLQRSTRRVRLTIVGERYHEHARRVLFELEQASATVEVFRSAPCGALRISTSVVLGQTLLAPLVLEYVAAFPAVSVFTDFSNRRVDLLEEGFDVAVRAGTLPESSLVARRVGQAGAGLYAAPDYLAQHGRPQEAEALRQPGALRRQAGCRGRAPGAGAGRLVDAPARDPCGVPVVQSLSPAVRAFVDLIAERLPARLAHNAAPD